MFNVETKMAIKQITKIMQVMEMIHVNFTAYENALRLREKT
jgi:hypothetical protein